MIRIVWFLLLGLGLSGCGLNLSLRPAYSVKTDKPFGFYVDDQGKIVVASTPLRVYVEPGALGGRLAHYEVVYVDTKNTEVIAGGPGGKGDLNVRIPPGCEVDQSPCPRYAQRFSEEFTIPVLDGQIVQAMLQAYQSGASTLNWRMRILWKAVDDNGAEHSWEGEYRIQFPVQ